MTVWTHDPAMEGWRRALIGWRKALETPDPIIAYALAGERGEEQRAIAEIGMAMVTMLLQKNERYGSSATNPIRVFSKAEPLEGIHLRMDDKLSRIRAGAADDDEDPVWDLAGYCVLEIVARRRSKDGEKTPLPVL